MLALLLLAIGHRADADGAALSDLADPVFQHHTREHGLPQGIVMALAEDGDGFLWAGTQGGLARWDGYRFRAFNAEAGNPDALQDGVIYALHTDRLGRLWIGTPSGRLSRYDGDHDRFVTYPAMGNSINAIADDGAGGLWLGNDAGLFQFDPATGSGRRFDQPVRFPAAGKEAAPLTMVQALLRDRQGRLWVGAVGGLVCIEADGRAIRTLPLPTDTGKTPLVKRLFEDDAGRLWIGTGRFGAYVLESGAELPRQVTETGGGSLTADSVLGIAQPGPGEIWLATFNGIVAVDPVSRRTRRLRHDPTLAGALAHDEVWDLLRDRAGTVWVGGTGGLDQLVGKQDGILTLFGARNRSGGLEATDVMAVLAAADGKTWLGLGEGGVAIHDPASGRITYLRPDPTRPETALPKTYVTGLAAFGDDVYIGTGGGLYRADRFGRSVRRVVPPNREPTESVAALHIDAGILWVSEGLKPMALAGDLPPALARLDDSQLTDQFVTGMSRGTGDELWVGTRNGLNRIDLASGAIERIVPDPADPAALATGFVSALVIDRRGRLWAGTEGGGIAVMTGRDGGGRPRFRHLGVADGLPHRNVDMLLQDGTGKIWASTDDGIAVVDPDSFAIRALRRAEGVAIPSYWLNAGAVARDGDLLFGGRGLTIVRPDRLSAWSYRPPVVVTDLRVGGKPVAAGRFNGGRAGEPLVIAADANNFAVEFAALDYSAPERNRYAYRLDGYDRDWNETEPTRRLAAYTNLSPGSYVLRLRGSNRDGVWSETALTLPIRVLPAWYQTLWFKALLAVLAIAAIVAIVQIRTAYLRRARKQLEQRVEERTRELRNAKDELERLATQDGLTQVANRRRFDAVLAVEAQRARREGRPLSVLMIDVDDFKAYNDLYGHLGGDDALRQVAALVQTAIKRPTDLLARYGGEEFGVILPDTDAAAALAIGERIVTAVFAAALPHRGASAADRVTVSVGAATHGDMIGADGEMLVAAADAALYQAKRAGRNRAMASRGGVGAAGGWLPREMGVKPG